MVPWTSFQQLNLFSTHSDRRINVLNCIGMYINHSFWYKLKPTEGVGASFWYANTISTPGNKELNESWCIQLYPTLHLDTSSWRWKKNRVSTCIDLGVVYQILFSRAWALYFWLMQLLHFYLVGFMIFFIWRGKLWMGEIMLYSHVNSLLAQSYLVRVRYLERELVSFTINLSMMEG